MRRKNPTATNEIFIGGKNRKFAFKAAKDGKCKGLSIIVGRTYKQLKSPKLCHNGYHACRDLDQVNKYYTFTPAKYYHAAYHIYPELYLVEILGEIDEGQDKICTNKMKVLKKLTPEEFNYFSSRFTMDSKGKITKRISRRDKMKEIIKGIK